MAVAGYSDKRRFPRVLYKTPLRYQIRGESRFKDVETFDLGLGGLSFNDESFLPANTPLKLEINLPYKTVKSEGKVIWTTATPHSDSYHLGIEFSNLDNKEVQTLDKFLNNRPLY